MRFAPVVAWWARRDLQVLAWAAINTYPGERVQMALLLDAVSRLHDEPRLLQLGQQLLALTRSTHAGAFYHRLCGAEVAVVAPVVLSGQKQEHLHCRPAESEEGRMPHHRVGQPNERVARLPASDLAAIPLSCHEA